MHGTLPADAQRAIFPGVTSDAEIFHENSGVRSDSESSGWFVQLARKLWSPKAPAAIEHLIGAPLSTAQRWCRGGSDITGSALRDLIRSEDGARVIDALLIGCKAKWVHDLRRGQLAIAHLDQWKQLDLGIE